MLFTINVKIVILKIKVMRRSSNNIGSTVGVLGFAAILVALKFLLFYVLFPIGAFVGLVVIIREFLKN